MIHFGLSELIADTRAMQLGTKFCSEPISDIPLTSKDTI